jgi:AcrR family transcriptional regulator
MAKRRRTKRPDSKRRIPQRAGSVATVEAIYEATARILQASGREGLNTNTIAEKAGISIGTLYGNLLVLPTLALRYGRFGQPTTL